MVMRFSIVSKVLIISIGTIIAMMLLFAYRTYTVNLVTFKNLEMQKLAVLGQSMLPVVSANMALGFADANEQYLGEVLQKNPELLKVELRGNDDALRINLIQKESLPTKQQSFVHTETIVDSITSQPAGTLVLHFSKHHYNQLLKEHLGFLLQGALAVVLAILILYWLLHHALDPLKLLVSHLSKYDPKQPFEPLDYSKEDEIATINNALTQMVERIEGYSKELQEKSRMAAMGEMIGNIAHQWRQPLMNINATMFNLDRAYELGKLDADTLDETIDKVNDLTEHMSKTIEDFRNFFRPDKPLAEISLDTLTQKALALMQGRIDTVAVVCDLRPVTIVNHEGELLQVLHVILSNALDALHHRRIQDRHIWITVTSDDVNAEIRIRDNAGGIDQEIMRQIFDPYFSTKSTVSGTGLGLYIAKLIIEHSMNGKLGVRNRDGGAEFTITLTKEMT